MLKLLALIARGLGFDDLENYEPPSVGIHDFLHNPPELPATGTAARKLEVMEFLSQAGGE